MKIKIEYSKKALSKSLSNLVLFSNEGFKNKDFKNSLSNSEFNYIDDLLKTSDLKKNLFVFEINSKKKIILVSIKNKLKDSDIESLGAEFFGRVNYGKNSEYQIVSDSVVGKHNNFLGHFLHGIKLKSYEFKKYKTKNNSRQITILITGTKNKPNFKVNLDLKL